MRAVGEGRLANDSRSFARHIDRCLGCRACEQVCPAGVQYGELLEAARGELFTSGPSRGFHYGALRFILKHIWLHPTRLRMMLGLTRFLRDSGAARLLLKTRIPSLISKRMAFGLALLTSSSNDLFSRSKSATPPHKSDRGTSVALFTGCIGSALFSRVNDATARVLAANGFAVETPDRQVCCGALHAHAGDLDGARTLARQNIEAFGNKETPVITNAGGCGAMLVNYAHLLANDEAYADAARGFSARVRDVSQHLEGVAAQNAETSSRETVTYDASCHLLYGQRAGEAPLKMLAAAGVGFAKLDGSERCCGAAGVYNLLEYDLSQRVLNEKLKNIQATGATILATGNPGCQMHIGAGALLAGMDLKVCHPVELLDEAYRQSGRYAEGE